VRTARAVDVIVAELQGLDPAGREGFAARGAELVRALEELDAELAARARAWTRKTIVTFHGSFGYFADRYGLTIAAVIEPSPGREPTPKYLTEVLAAIRASGAAALFSEPQLDRGPAAVIAQQAGLPLGELDPIGGGPGAGSYEALLRKNAAELDRFLR
jgi:ABC-type Zn uptake system ZnuABC Zn-binding protein ZnuA